MEKRILYPLITCLYDKVVGPQKAEGHNLEFWRERIYGAVSITQILLGFIALIVSILACIPGRMVFIALFDGMIYISLLLVLFNRRIPLEIKTSLLCFFLYLIGVVLLLLLGKIGAGYAWLFSFPVIAGILKGLKAGVVSVMINAVTLIMIGVFLIHLGLFPNLPIEEYDILAWMTVSVNFVLLNALVTVAIGVILRGLKISMQEQQKLAASLTQKKEQLQKSNLKLRQEIKKRIQTELDLRETIGLAESANIVKSEFLSNVSHEIRTPLNAIMGFSGLLTGSIEGDTTREYVRLIQAAGHDLLTLINKILDVSRVESEKMTIKKDIVDIKKIYSDLKILFEKQIEDKGLHSEFVLQDNGIDFIIHDEIRIKQVVMNVIENAVKFTQAGEIGVFFHLVENKDRGKVDLIIEVRDTGIGIPESDFENIFETFWQKDGKATREYEGTGIGLSLARKLTRLMNGEIQVESTVGQGSLFRILFQDLERPSEELLKQKNISKYSMKISKEVDSDSPVKNGKAREQIVHILQTDILPQIQDLEGNAIINDILQFSHSLHNLSQEYDDKILRELARKLISSSLTYDMQKIMTGLQELRQYARQLASEKPAV
ncbi:MAG: hypothetical protein JXQ65_08860 [Candidatus Marinimicrobia bacterium]|nr:hypothetical protein [Candidatus Neomarinimicrobiota bacterium]